MNSFSPVYQEFSIYVHVPFCAVRCGYCDFNTYTPDELQKNDSISSWQEAIRSEIKLSREKLPAETQVTTIFFGGGTPSLIDPAILDNVLNEISANFKVSNKVEMTIEANPDTITTKTLKHWQLSGINRISIGMQSADSSVLKTLDRTHNPENVKRSVELIRQAGFENFSLDLIYGTPGESINSWENTIQTALSLDPPHISAYSLTIEPGTQMHRKLKSNKIENIDADDQADKYLLADSLLEQNNLKWYEISNWAKSGYECKHNLSYWRNKNWWGYGPGAHSHINQERWWNVKHPYSYAKKVKEEQSAIEQVETLLPEQVKMEQIMLKMRIRETDLNEFVTAPQLKSWEQRGYLEFLNGQPTLNTRGRLVLDSLVNEITE